MVVRGKVLNTGRSEASGGGDVLSKGEGKKGRALGGNGDLISPLAKNAGKRTVTQRPGRIKVPTLCGPQGERTYLEGKEKVKWF